MALPVYPGKSLLKGLTYSSKWTPRFFVQTAVAATGAETDVPIAQYPLHDFELTYKFLRDGVGWNDALSALEFRTMMGFHLMMQGSAGRCLYQNPDDNQVWRQPLGTGDGSTTAFTLIRTFGANGYTAAEPVGQVDPTTINVYLGTSTTPVAPALYTINIANPVANTITFVTPPSAGTPVSIDMSYFYYCKLVNDAPQFEKFMNRLWALGKVQLRSLRPGT